MIGFREETAIANDVDESSEDVRDTAEGEAYGHEIPQACALGQRFLDNVTPDDHENGQHIAGIPPLIKQREVGSARHFW